jgi:hypothetical protein
MEYKDQVTFPVMIKNVNYVAKIQYPDKKPVWFGNLVVPLETSMEDVRAQMINMIDGCLPMGELCSDNPFGYTLLDLVRGQIWITFDD